MLFTSMLLISAFVVGSMTYIYLFRGHVRYEKLSEYLRKGWPLFAPMNCLLYMLTQARAKKPILNLDDFSELDEIKKNWETIREEAVELYRQGHLETTNKPDSLAYYDIGFRTFYKYGWSKFYLKWYGYTHKSALNLCPKTVEILSTIPSVNGAMFSILPIGSKLTRHLDPIASSLRYHLGLATPNSNDCFINVDGEFYSWRNGEALLFDETYIHYARNDSENYRLILMCDVDRPMAFIGNIFNGFLKFLMRLSIVPNAEGDKSGFANTVFYKLAPLLKRSKALKQSNKNLYVLIKYSVNLSLIALVFAMLSGLFYLFKSIVTMSI